MVLAIALFTLVILSLVAGGGFLMAARQRRAAQATRNAAAALYAAEAGLAAALSQLDTLDLDSLPAGLGKILFSHRLEGGDELAVSITRVSPDSASSSYFLARSEGRAHGAGGGRREIGSVLRRRAWSDLCCAAALTAGGSVVVHDAAVLSGLDTMPKVWAENSECDGPPDGDRPGLLLSSELDLKSAAGTLEGDPPLYADSDSLLAVSKAARFWYDELGSEPDLRYAADAVLPEIRPAALAEGGCDRDAPGNWGAPNDPAHPCAGYFPVILTAGNLIIDSPGGGQGILLVGGDLTLRGGFRFSGYVITRGRLRVEASGGGVLGRAISLETGEGAVQLDGGSDLHFSRCALDRALRGSKVQQLQPLAHFAWFEILE